MDEHLTRELFRAIATGWRNPGDLAAIALAHLFEFCPECRGAFEGWRQEVETGSSIPETPDYEAVIDRIRVSVEESPGGGESPVRSEIQRARSRTEELLRLGPEDRAAWIRSEAERFRVPLLADVLIEEAKRRTPAYPRKGYTLASLARMLLLHAPTSNHHTVLYARAMAHMANAVRVVGDLPRANQILADARYMLRSQGGGDRLVRAELDRLESALRTNQYQRDKAIPLFLRALMTYRLESADRDAASTLIGLAGAHHRFGDPRRGLICLDEAERVLESDPDPWLEFFILQSRALCLCRSDQPDLAREVFEQGGKLADRFDDPLMPLRRSWASGRIALKLADLDLAEHRLILVREGYAHLRFGYDVAQVSFELGWLYLHQGRFKEAEAQADQALPTFEELGLPRRVAATLELRAQAAAG